MHMSPRKVLKGSHAAQDGRALPAEHAASRRHSGPSTHKPNARPLQTWLLACPVQALVHMTACFHERRFQTTGGLASATMNSHTEGSPSWQTRRCAKHLRLQAQADARTAGEAQAAWLKANLAPHFTQKLLRVVRDILKWVAAHDGEARHQFPLLAGSHLTEVCLAA